MPRDFQKQKVYDAEFFVRDQLKFANEGGNTVDFFGSTLTVPCELKFGTLDAVEEYYRRLQATTWFSERYVTGHSAHRPVSVRHRKTGHHAHYQAGEVAINVAKYGQSWAMREIVVLHEFAHHCSPVSGHGPEFVETFIWLVSNAMSPEVGLLLTASMDQHAAQRKPS